MLRRKPVVLYGGDKVEVLDTNTPDFPLWSELFPGCRQLTILWTSTADPVWATPEKRCVGFSLQNVSSLGLSGEVRVFELIDQVVLLQPHLLDERRYWKLFWLASDLTVYIPPPQPA